MTPPAGDAGGAGRSPASDTREKLLEVAETLFARGGFAGAPLEAISREVGVRKTALYHYFPSKAALYVAVLERMLDHFDRAIAAALARDLPPRDRLGGLLDGLNDLLAGHPNYSQILIRIFVDDVPVDASAITPKVESIIGRVLRFHRDGVRAGVFRNLSARHFFQSLLGAVVFHYSARNFSAAVLDVDDVFARGAVAWRRDQVRELLTRGVLAED